MISSRHWRRRPFVFNDDLRARKQPCQRRLFTRARNESGLRAQKQQKVNTKRKCTLLRAASSSSVSSATALIECSSHFSRNDFVCFRIGCDFVRCRSIGRLFETDVHWWHVRLRGQTMCGCSSARFCWRFFFFFCSLIPSALARARANERSRQQVLSHEL